MSIPLQQNGGMKNRIKPLVTGKNERTVTTFGAAKLVWLRDGSTELRGGRAEERTAAKEWISLFMHEAVPRFTR